MDEIEIQKIKKLVEEIGERARFVGQADENEIKRIEENLKVTLPESYKWFLKEYGYAQIPGFEIEGSGLAKMPSCLVTTLNWRKHGLPGYLVVIQDEGEWVYCLDTSRIENEECPIFDWDQRDGIGSDCYGNFLTYFKIRLRESLEDL